MNIFSLVFGLLTIGGVVYCLGRLLISMATGNWRRTLKVWAAFFGSLALICLLLWLGDPYERTSVTSPELVGTYRISEAAKQRLSITGYSDFTGTLTLNHNGACSATRLPACCVHGGDESHSHFRGGYVSFNGTWEIEHVSDVFKVRLELRNLTVDEGSREGMYDSITLTVVKGQPRCLAFSIFNGDFDDLVYEPQGMDDSKRGSSLLPEVPRESSLQ